MSTTLSTKTPRGPQHAPDLAANVRSGQRRRDLLAVERVADDEVGARVVAAGEQVGGVADAHVQARRRAQPEVLAGELEHARSSSYTSLVLRGRVART